VNVRSAGLAAVALALLGAPAAPQAVIPFDSPRWDHLDSQVAEHLGRLSMQGTAMLRDAELRDGVIAFDIAVDGRRSYPGVLFRMEGTDTYEHVYVRPHRAGLYPDAVQYTPEIHGISSWQLYNGDGYTAGTRLSTGTWVPVRVEIKGSQARVFVGSSEAPTLEIHHLELEARAGAIALTGPKDGSAWFSDFRFYEDSTLTFAAPPPAKPVAGVLRDWWISNVYPAEKVGKDKYPNFYGIFGAGWRPATAAPSGLVDISKVAGRANPQDPAGDLVLARTFIQADEARDVTFTLGYSDDVEFFLNGRHLFTGRSGYQYRDPSFLGILGPFDDLHVHLEKGLNEILLMVTERFGGWGFNVRADTTLTPKRVAHERAAEVWRTPAELLTPESAVYDPRRGILYVSSFDNQYDRKDGPTGYITKLSLDGQILEKEWVSGLSAPTGMAIWHDTLYVAERQDMAAIDLATGTVTGRWTIPDVEFPNDLVIDSTGAVYISDTRTSNWPDSRVYRFRNGTFDVFANEGISRANGLWIHDGYLLVGSSGDGHLKRIRLTDGVVEPVIALGACIIDGIRVDESGSYLVSCWEGQVFVISPDGRMVEVLDDLPAGLNTADFEYRPERHLLIVPTFMGNSVVAYRLTGG
jgi:sugar lactone lactonase YvrE